MKTPGRRIAATVTRGAVRCSAWLGAFGEAFIWKVPNGGPILLAHILVDLDWDALAIKSVAAATLAAGNPVILSGSLLSVVGLEATADDSVKDLVAIVDGPARSIESDAPDTSRSDQTTSLPFDIHDARLHGSV